MAQNKKKKNNKKKVNNTPLVIPDTMMVECPWCGGEFPVIEWSEATRACCTSREMVRDYKALNEPITWKNDPGYYFKCPDCATWTGGYSLRPVHVTDKRLRKLGGKPIIEIADCKDEL